MTTDTPGRGEPSSAEVTLPIILRPCAQAVRPDEHSKSRLRSKNFLMSSIEIVVWLKNLVIE
jgi:hypothetical protein